MAWVISISFGLMWLAIASSNAYYLWQAHRQGGSTSLTLFVGGVMGMIAVLALPIANTWYWCWLPLLLDVGCVPALWKIWRNKDESDA